MFILDTHKRTHTGKGKSRTDKSELFAFVLACVKHIPLKPPSSPAGSKCETFSQPIRSNLCFILPPSALDIVKINCLVHWANVLPPGVIQMSKAWLSGFSQFEFGPRDRRIPHSILFTKGLTPPPLVKSHRGVNLAIKSQLWALLTCKFLSPCHSAIELRQVGQNCNYIPTSHNCI